YYRETDINFDNFGWNACRRSSKSWQRKTVLPGMGGASLGTLVDKGDNRVDFQSVACSGSTADQADGGSTPYYFTNPPSSLSTYHGVAEGQFSEVAQVDSGVLSGDTTLVLVSAGG